MKHTNNLLAAHPLASKTGVSIVMAYLAADDALRRKVKFHDTHGKRLRTAKAVMDALIRDGEVKMEKT